MSKKIIRIDFPNGESYEVPAKVIATSRTNYYAKKDNINPNSVDWYEEYDRSMKPDELIDWIQNNMIWDDIKDHAILLDADNEDISYDEMWSATNFEIKIK